MKKKIKYSVNYYYYYTTTTIIGLMHVLENRYQRVKIYKVRLPQYRIRKQENAVSIVRFYEFFSRSLYRVKIMTGQEELVP